MTALAGGPFTHGHIPHTPAGLAEFDPLAGQVGRFTQDVGIPSHEGAAALRLVAGVASSGRFSEALDSLSSPFYVPDLAQIVEDTASDAPNVDRRVAVLGALTSESGLAACDPDVPHISPIEIGSAPARLQALGHPAASNWLVSQQGLPPEVAIIAGNRHSDEPIPVSHGTGDLPTNLRPTRDVSAAALTLAEWQNGNVQDPARANHARQRLEHLFAGDMYGADGDAIVDEISSTYGLPEHETDPPEERISWGVGVESKDGEISHLIVPSMGDNDHRIILPVRGGRFSRLSYSTQAAAERITMN